jgi:hypothetical protein
LRLLTDQRAATSVHRLHIRHASGSGGPKVAKRQLHAVLWNGQKSNLVQLRALIMIAQLLDLLTGPQGSVPPSAASAGTSLPACAHSYARSSAHCKCEVEDGKIRVHIDEIMAFAGAMSHSQPCPFWTKQDALLPPAAVISRACAMHVPASTVGQVAVACRGGKDSQVQSPGSGTSP